MIAEPPFEAFMLVVHEHGTSGLGYRKALEAYEAAKLAALPQDKVERAARAIRPEAFSSWERNVANSLSDGKNQDEAEEFAAFCDGGMHPLATVKKARAFAQAALAAMPEPVEVGEEEFLRHFDSQVAKLRDDTSSGPRLYAALHAAGFRIVKGGA